MTVSYEWCIGITDPETEDLSVDFHSDAKSAVAAYRRARANGDTATLELVRNQGNDVDGLTNRSWAAVNFATSTLPEYTDYGGGEQAHKIPRRLHDQIANALANLNKTDPEN